MINFFLLAVSFLATWLHPFHASVCDIEFKDESKSLQVSQRVFMDDLELALNKRFGTSLDLTDQSQAAYRDSLIQVYIFENLLITVDGKEKKRTYIGNEIEEDGMWCYIEYEGVKRFRNMEVRSTILLELYDDQANIIHYKYGDYEKSTKLDINRKSAVFAMIK